jgi:hypothetical protein
MNAKECKKAQKSEQEFERKEDRSEHVERLKVLTFGRSERRGKRDEFLSAPKTCGAQ